MKKFAVIDKGSWRVRIIQTDMRLNEWEKGILFFISPT